MKYLIVSVILFSCLTAQDVLILKNGVKYTGKYERSTEDLIYFIQEGNKYANGVAKDQIEIVILEDGTVVYTGVEINEKKLEQAGKLLEEIKLTQDTLITSMGNVIVGEYIKTTGEFIEFKIIGADYSMFPKKSIIARVILEGGQIVYDDGTYIASSPSSSVKSTPGITAIKEFNANTYKLELRQTEAMEKIATVQTFFMYYAIAVIIISVIIVANAS